MKMMVKIRKDQTNAFVKAKYDEFIDQGKFEIKKSKAQTICKSSI